MSEFPFVYFSFEKYIETLHNFKDWVKGKEHYLFIPGHGSPFSGKEALDLRLKESLTYLEEVKTHVLKTNHLMKSAYGLDINTKKSRDFPPGKY
ncbi:MAG: hypothetical protein R2879_03725 [Saprospiraceae bacterium]